jgi:hypothetical protein
MSSVEKGPLQRLLSWDVYIHWLLYREVLYSDCCTCEVPHNDCSSQRCQTFIDAGERHRAQARLETWAWHWIPLNQFYWKHATHLINEARKETIFPAPWTGKQWLFITSTSELFYFMLAVALRAEYLLFCSSQFCTCTYTVNQCLPFDWK